MEFLSRAYGSVFFLLWLIVIFFCCIDVVMVWLLVCIASPFKQQSMWAWFLYNIRWSGLPPSWNAQYFFTALSTQYQSLLRVRLRAAFCPSCGTHKSKVTERRDGLHSIPCFVFWSGKGGAKVFVLCFPLQTNGILPLPANIPRPLSPTTCNS